MKKKSLDANAVKSIKIMAGIGVLFIAAITITVIKLNGATDGSKPSSVPPMGNDEGKTIGSTPEQSKKMIDADLGAAKKAKESGESYIPLSSGGEVPIVANDGSAAAPVPAVDKGKAGDFSLPSFPDDPNKPAKTVAYPSPQGGGGGGYNPVATSSGAPSYVTVNGKVVDLPSDPNQRSAVLDQLNQQEKDRVAAEAAGKRLALKMTRINQIAEYIAKNDDFAPIKATDPWIAATSSVSAATSPTASLASTVSATPGKMIIKTGEKVYVNIETAINTDESPEVFGTILSGGARGWVIFGKVAQNKDYTVSVKFDKLALPSGKSVAISAIAIDPETGRTSVQGDVNHKIFTRFVLPIIAGGASTYGQLMGQQGMQSYVSPLTGAPATLTNNISMSQVRDAALGNGLSNVATKLSAGADSTPSTSTDKNLGIEVIFQSEVMVSVPSRTGN